MKRRNKFPSMLSVTLAVSCQASPQADRREWTEGSVTVFTEEGVRPCAGTPAFLGRYVDGIGNAWTDGAWEDVKQPLTLELRARPEHDAAGRATQHNEAWIGQQRGVLHELVHLVTATADGVSAPSLGEGAAEALGNSSFLETWGEFFYAEHPEVFAFLAPEEYYGGENYYPASGQTTAALSRRYGMDAVRRAYQLAPRRGSPQQIESAYVEAFGEGIYDAFDEIAQERPCGLRVWQCDPEVVPTVALPFGFTSEQTAACEEQPGLIGAAFSGDENWFPEAVFAFEFEEETTFVYQQDNAFIYGFFCRDTCEGRDGTPPDVVYPYSEGETTLPAGRYFFRVRSGDRVNPFSFRFDPV